MSFPVALRSAVFYVLACTPCLQVRHQHKVKKQAKKERIEKAKLEVEQPGLYRHPSPYNTNPFWQEEIMMGPSLPKKATSKNSSQRGLMSAGGESSVMSESDHNTNVGDSRINFTDSRTAMPEEDALSDDWNTRHGYQREDEELWGVDWSGHKIKDAFSKARDSAGRLIESTLGKEKEITDEDRRAFYFAPRNPPVNEYHPPVVSSKPLHKDAHKWMLQPPPSAKVMEGKVPVSRAGSAASKASGKTLVADDTHLARSLQEKLMMEKIRESLASEEELLDSLFGSRSRSLSYPRARSLSFDGSDELIDGPFDRPRTSSRLQPMAVPPGFESEDDFEDIITPRRQQSTSQSSRVGFAARRPNLETIPSSEGSGHRVRPRSKRSTKSVRSRRQMSIRMRKNLTSPVGDDSD